jgi:hypothetical protein
MRAAWPADGLRRGAHRVLLLPLLAGLGSCTAAVTAPDTSAPVVLGSTPTGVLAFGTTSVTLTAVTDEPATCRYDVADVAYAAMATALDGSGVEHVAPLAGLSSGVAYAYYVRCIDARGNAARSSHRAAFRVAGGVPTILWTDDIQGTSDRLGFDGFGVEHPIGTAVNPSDANGANLSRVANPLPGGGHAMRHFGTFDAGGSRAQAGIYGDFNTVFGQQARRPEGIWVAQEWYFPEAIGARDDPWCWLAVWDWHSIDAGTRGNRWHTAPGLLIARDGSMRLELVWGGPASVNGDGIASTLSMPVGRWFDIEMHYQWVDTPTGTIQVWIDGELALEQAGAQTRERTHGVVETYMKFYGSTQGNLHGPWTPTPTLKYTRNVRVAGERIWR